MICAFLAVSLCLPGCPASPSQISKYLASQFRLMVCDLGEPALLCFALLIPPLVFLRTQIWDSRPQVTESCRRSEVRAWALRLQLGQVVLSGVRGRNSPREIGDELEAAQATRGEPLRQGSDSGRAWGRQCQVGLTESCLGRPA